jgi:hypothetical protein
MAEVGTLAYLEGGQLYTGPIQSWMGRSEVDQHHGRCCRLFGDIRLWACSLDAASGAGLFAVGGVLSLFGLHLAEFATKEIMVGSRGLCTD